MKKLNFTNLLWSIPFLLFFCNSVFAQINSYELENKGYLTNPVICPNGIVFSDNHYSSIYLHRNNSLIILHQSPGCGKFYSISKDLNYLAFKIIHENGNQIPAIINIKNGKLRHLKNYQKLCGQPVFDSIGNIWFTSNDSLICLNTIERRSWYLGFYTNLISVSSHLISFSDNKGQISIFNVKNSGTEVISDNKTTYLYPTFSPDGLKLSYSDIFGKLFIYSFNDRRTVKIGEGGYANWTTNSKNLIFQQSISEKDKLIFSEIKVSDLQGNISSIETAEIKYPSFPHILENNTIVFTDYSENQIFQGEINLIKFDINISNRISISGINSLKKYAKQSRDSFSANIENVPYINQVYDTPDWHDGHASCAPTTAIMNIAFHELLPYWPDTVNSPYPHVSLFGNYIADKYHFNEYYYDDYVISLGTDSWGAHGFMWYASGSPNSTMEEFYENHKFQCEQKWTTSCFFNDIIDEINDGYPFTICSWLTSSGHLTLATGYIEAQKSIVFHDPYGDKNTGGYPSYDGDYVIYDWPSYNNGYQNLDADGTHGGIAWSISTHYEKSFQEDSIIDDMDYYDGFYVFNQEPSHMKYFRDQVEGYLDHSWYTLSIDSEEDVCFVEWTKDISESGIYNISAFIPANNSNAQSCKYKIISNENDTTITVNQTDYSDAWLWLGNYYFTTNDTCKIRLGDNTGVENEWLVFDAIRFSRNLNIGIKEKPEQKLMVYPNPAKDLLYIESSEYGLIQIIDLQGKVILHKNIRNKEEIKLTKYNSGLYILNFESKNYRIRQKLIIQ